MTIPNALPYSSCPTALTYDTSGFENKVLQTDKTLQIPRSWLHFTWDLKCHAIYSNVGFIQCICMHESAYIIRTRVQLSGVV